MLNMVTVLNHTISSNKNKQPPYSVIFKRSVRLFFLFLCILIFRMELKKFKHSLIWSLNVLLLLKHGKRSRATAILNPLKYRVLAVELRDQQKFQRKNLKRKSNSCRKRSKKFLWTNHSHTKKVLNLRTSILQRRKSPKEGWSSFRSKRVKRL